MCLLLFNFCFTVRHQFYSIKYQLESCTHNCRNYFFTTDFRAKNRYAISLLHINRLNETEHAFCHICYCSFEVTFIIFLPSSLKKIVSNSFALFKIIMYLNVIVSDRLHRRKWLHRQWRSCELRVSTGGSNLGKIWRRHTMCVQLYNI